MDFCGSVADLIADSAGNEIEKKGDEREHRNGAEPAGGTAACKEQLSAEDKAKDEAGEHGLSGGRIKWAISVNWRQPGSEKGRRSVNCHLQGPIETYAADPGDNDVNDLLSA